MATDDIATDRLVIHPLELEDAPRLQAIYEAAGDYFGGAGAVPADAALQELRQCRAAPGRMAAVISHREGGDVGAVGWWPGKPSPEVALLGMLVVTPEHRGAGMAAEALRGVQKALAPTGITQLRTAVPYSRLAAVRPFLVALGFREMPIAEHTRMGMAGAGIALWEKAIG